VKARPGELLGTMLHLNRCWKLWATAVNDFTPPNQQDKIRTFLYYPIKLQDFQIEKMPILRKFSTTWYGIK
jgi:hypothetical protein